MTYKRKKTRCENCGTYTNGYPLCYDCYQKELENTCEYCGEYSNGYPLCYDCYQLSQEKIIIQDRNGNWINNVIKGNEDKFYDENKEYTKKDTLLTKNEGLFYTKLIKTVNKNKHIICPQVGLRAIIETNTKTNNELYRSVDFTIINNETYEPILLIEINGNEHYEKDYTIARDDSVQKIAHEAQIPLFTLTNKEAKDISINKLQSSLQIIYNYIENFKPTPKKGFKITDITLDNIEKLKLALK